MLRWRLILGTAIIAALAGLCWLDARAAYPGMYLAPVALFAAALSTGEMLRLFRARGLDPAPWSVYVGTVVPVVMSCLPVMVLDLTVIFSIGCLGWLALGLAMGMLVVAAGEMQRYDPPRASIPNLAAAALSVLYIGGGIGMIVQLRLIRAPADVGGLRGIFPLLTAIAAVKLSDTAQYFIGRRFGIRKLAPVLSPSKTWEGAVGGGLAASLLMTLIISLLQRHVSGLDPPSIVLLWCFAASVAIGGVFGDLAESLLKRDAGVKDSSDWMPGFGGVLDVLDSLLFAAPVAYMWIVTGILAF